MGASVLTHYKPQAIQVVKLKLPTSDMSNDASASAPTAVQAVAVEPPAPEQTPLEAMLGRLSEGDKEVFLTRLKEADDKYAEVKGQVSSAETKAAEATKILSERNADGALVKQQIAHLAELLSQTGAAVEAERVKDIPSYLGQSPAHTEYALERVVQACSRALAGGSVGAPRAAKRRAVDHAPASPAVTQAPAGIGSTSEVRNLLRSHFDGV